MFKDVLMAEVELGLFLLKVPVHRVEVNDRGRELGAVSGCFVASGRTGGRCACGTGRHGSFVEGVVIDTVMKTAQELVAVGRREVHSAEHEADTLQVVVVEWLGRGVVQL